MSKKSTLQSKVQQTLWEKVLIHSQVLLLANQGVPSPLEKGLHAISANLSRNQPLEGMALAWEQIPGINF